MMQSHVLNSRETPIAALAQLLLVAAIRAFDRLFLWIVGLHRSILYRLHKAYPYPHREHLALAVLRDDRDRANGEERAALSAEENYCCGDHRCDYHKYKDRLHLPPAAFQSAHALRILDSSLWS